MDNWNKIKPPFGTPPDPAWVKSMDCVGLWTMNERAGIKIFDGSGNNNTGTMTNVANPSTATSGWAGQGLNFDGVDDYVNVANATNFDLSATSFTISGWFSSSYIDDSSGIIIQRFVGGTPGAGYGIAITKTTGLITFTFRGSPNGISITSATNYLDNKWHYFTATANISTGYAYLYVDGLQAGSDTFSGLINFVGVLDIGTLRSAGVPGYCFQGSLDDVRIFNTPLDINEIKHQYSEPYYMFPKKTIKYFIPAMQIPIAILQSGQVRY